MSDPKHVSEQETLVAPFATTTGGTPFSDDETRPVFGDRYEVLSLLGSGGMGTVYMARDRELEEIVALKVLRQEALSTPGALEMFRREVKLARRVTHPNVARTFDIGEAGGSRYLTMEYIEGTSLARLVDRFGPNANLTRPADRATDRRRPRGGARSWHRASRSQARERARAEHDRVAITDFGIARPVENGSHTLTTGVAVGTPAYMAPEQVEARRDIDGRADIYALGVLLYEVLTGDLPFTGDSALAVAAARLVKPPPDVRSVRKDVPDALAEVVLRCMARNRDDRFSSIEQVLAALATMTAPLSSIRASGMPSVLPHVPFVKAVAVLPFKNVGASDDAFTADGLSDELIDGLSMTQGLRVRPRSSLARFADLDRDPRDVGRELGVDVVVEGSVRRLGDMVRVTARLISVADGFQLWAKRFDRQSRDLFALSDEIAETIARALTLSRDVPQRGAPVDTIAMDLYLKARVEHRKVFSGGVDGAAALYEKALERAPSDPTILAGYAIVQVRRWFFGNPDAVEIARAAAEKALAIAPHLIEARYALAVLKLHSGDARGALEELRAIIAKGESALAHETLAGVLAEMGLVEEARAHLDTALKIDPESPLSHMELGRYYALKGMWAEVDLTMDRLARTTGTARDAIPARMRFAFWRRAINQDALKTVTGSIGPVNEQVLQLLSTSDATNRAQATEAFAKSGASGSLRRAALMHQIEAEIASYKGDGAWALEAVKKSMAAGLFDISWLRDCPLLDALHAQPGYAEVEREMAKRAADLVAFWQGL